MPGSSNDSVQVLSRALDQAGDLLDHVRPDDLERSTPCEDWDVAALVDHLVDAPGRFLTMVRGEQPDWSAGAPHLAEGWGLAFRAHADDLIRVLPQSSTEDGPDPAMEIAELAVHTWDVATALGRDVAQLDREVAERGLEFMQANLEPKMRGAAFGPEHQAPADAGPYERIAAFAGRDLTRS
jgi:uncharacterized protein (TIGR03086 family)